MSMIRHIPEPAKNPTSMKQLKFLSFDLDDTLYDNGPVIRQAFQDLYDYLVSQYPEIGSLFSLKQFIRRAHEIRAQHPHEFDYTILRHIHIGNVLTEAGYPDADTTAAYEVFIDSRQQVVLYDQTVEVLEMVAKQFPLIAITNGNALPERIGIGDYIQQTFNPGNCGFAKPDPRIYQHVCQQLAIRPEQLLHIGDCLDNDFNAAHQAGCQAIWLNHKQHARSIQPQVKELSELIPLIDRFSA